MADDKKQLKTYAANIITKKVISFCSNWMDISFNVISHILFNPFDCLILHIYVVV